MIKSALDLSSARPQDRFELAAMAAAPWAEIAPVGEATDYMLRWQMWCMGDLVLTEAAFTAKMLDRPPRRYRQKDNEYLLLQYYASGEGRVRIDDMAALHPSGHVFLLDLSREFHNLVGTVHTRGLLIPHAAIGYDPSRHSPIIGLPANGPHGRVLAHALWSLPGRIDLADGAEAERIAQDVARVVRDLMLDGPARANGDAVRRARRLAIESFIEARLGSPALDIAAICAAFGLSRASLYRHFPDPGGIADYIRERRLRAAYRDLADYDAHRGRVREVAERWGFADPGHFHRLFRRAFDRAPSEVALHPVPPSDLQIVDTADLLRSWLTSQHPQTAVI